MSDSPLRALSLLAASVLGLAYFIGEPGYSAQKLFEGPSRGSDILYKESTQDEIKIRRLTFDIKNTRAPAYYEKALKEWLTAAEPLEHFDRNEALWVKDLRKQELTKVLALLKNIEVSVKDIEVLIPKLDTISPQLTASEIAQMDHLCSEENLLKLVNTKDETRKLVLARLKEQGASRRGLLDNDFKELPDNY